MFYSFVSFLSNNIIICHDCASRCRRKWTCQVLKLWLVNGFEPNQLIVLLNLNKKNEGTRIDMYLQSLNNNHMNSHRNHMNRIFYKNIFKSLDLCVLTDTSSELFCIFGDFYAWGMQDSEVIKQNHWNTPEKLCARISGTCTLHQFKNNK